MSDEATRAGANPAAQADPAQTGLAATENLLIAILGECRDLARDAARMVMENAPPPYGGPNASMDVFRSTVHASTEIADTLRRLHEAPKVAEKVQRIVVERVDRPAISGEGEGDPPGPENE